MQATHSNGAPDLEGVATPDPRDRFLDRRVGGKFVIEKFLGGGAMGLVYSARDESLDRVVALKVMQPAVAVDPSYVYRFHKEARAASRIDHPNAMRIIEFGVEPDGLPYIAMEYLEGRDLHSVITDDWPLSDARIADVLMKTLSVLGAGHDMGVVHRDMKPENIMILSRKDDEGRDSVKVCDFGIAQISERDVDEKSSRRRAGAKLTTPGVVIGTPEYMSPEQARGEVLDARSDLYSVGIILYELLTGRTPFSAETPLAIVLKQIQDPPPPPQSIFAGVHEGLAAVCMKSLAKAKDERFQSAREMRLAIRAAVDGRPTPVDSSAVTLDASEPTVAPQPTTSEPKKSARPLRWLLLGGAVLGAGTALGFLASRAPNVPPPALAASVPSPPTVSSQSTPPQIASGSVLVDVVPPAKSVDVVASVAPRRRIQPAIALTSHEPRSETIPVVLPSAAPSVSAPPATLPDAPEAPAPPPPPRVVPTASPAPAAFDARVCRARLGSAKSASTYSIRDLTLRGTEDAWTECARKTTRERPSAPIQGVVRVRFRDTRSFSGASCTGCPPALAECVSTATQKTAEVHFVSGDATGEPEFDVPFTVTCE